MPVPPGLRPTRRVLVLVVLVGVLHGVLAPGPASAGPAAPPGVLWTGHTSQGHPLRFRTVRRDGVRHVVSVVGVFDLTCTETGEVLTVGFGTQPDEPISSGALDFDLVVFNNAFHWSGTIRTFEAEGAISFAVAAFTPDEALQRCETGTLGWKAHRHAAARATAIPRPADGWIRPSGRILGITVDRRPGAGPAGGGDVLGVYFGETQQRLGLFFEVLGSEAAPYLGTYDIAALAECPDPSFAVGLQILGFADLPIPGGTWAIDDVSLFAAVHWDGTVDTDPARGTLSMAFPAFTPDEELGVCASGRQLWRASAG